MKNQQSCLDEVIFLNALQQAVESIKSDLIPSCPAFLQRTLKGSGQWECVVQLLRQFLSLTTFNRQFSQHLIDFAQNTNHAYAARKVTIFILENQVLHLPVDAVDEFDWLFGVLNLKKAGTRKPLRSFVLKEGFTCQELSEFIPQFRLRLLRLARVHHQIQGAQTTPQGLHNFLHQSQLDCKLTLARYLFSASEVTQWIQQQLLHSQGVHNPLSNISNVTEGEAEMMMSSLPPFESSILRQLCDLSDIYWVDPATNRTIKALVESPVTTVVAVIKPPGSDVEFEIKRTGMGAYPLLDIRYSVNHYMVSPPHRIQGGAMGGMLCHEGHTAALLAQLYRLVHQQEAPISRTAALKNIYQVPTPQGDTEYLHQYFTQPARFGKDYPRMRTEMLRAINAFASEKGIKPLNMSTELGQTAEFLKLINPKQSILVHTTSFRLDKLARYLAPDGDQVYFQQGLKVDYSLEDAQLFADELLDEILGVYLSPTKPCSSYQDYIEAAFAVRENRKQADNQYLEVLQQFGKLWGTLLAFRGHSHGESFVARNVGLKSVWCRGQWRVQLYSMDHDCMHIDQMSKFDPKVVVKSTGQDIDHIFGRVEGNIRIKGSIPYLGDIYRASPQLRQEGWHRFAQATVKAYRKTQAAILQNSDIQDYFHSDFMDHLKDWDHALQVLLQNLENHDKPSAWKVELRQWLQERGYSQQEIKEFISTMKKHVKWLPKLSFLYEL
ncbi:hypothetical protein IQ260_18110 [Leptolyngbya cf. ectocarpi LEGE 11479]|uniref:Uncharacterized protein n=1 Tax=Leptolyngbya cf. ectocarpi LEGE 11479 TaxID=1828722 RepID=A0A928ZW66_LEPEC|nr:hypothetical protein [Leptolyngbya ectocarpi]MBE9068564.1 hypothetical protein [Leptolyngbya cf. ectocarpi LEGE 11479]